MRVISKSLKGFLHAVHRNRSTWLLVNKMLSKMASNGKKSGSKHLARGRPQVFVNILEKDYF